MSYLQRAAFVTELVKRLRARDSWAGATHVQKAAYLLQEMLGVPLGVRFRLYKYGPFSDALRDELDEMQTDGFIEVEPQRPPYGPRLRRAEAAHALEEKFGHDVERYRPQLDFIVDELANLGVGDLERLTTAFYVTTEDNEEDISSRAARITAIKPHVPVDEAEDAVREIDRIVRDAPHA